VKLLAVVLVPLAAIVAFIFGIVLVSGDAAPASSLCGYPSDLAVILDTIRTQESSGDYTARSAGSTASGAYQFLDTTWASYGGLSSAYLAPAAVQDARAAAWVTVILAADNGAVETIPVNWYIGHIPTTESAEWDTVPYPEAGNTITPRQYVARWLAIYAAKMAVAASTAAVSTTTSTTSVRGSLGTSSAVATVEIGGCRARPTLDGFALPVPRSLIDQRPELLALPHHDYPAWDFPTPIGTPVFAVHGGTVSRITNSPQNCYPDGIGCDKCGLGVVITDSEGTGWTYCHASAVSVATGEVVIAGDRIVTSGNSGFSTGSHLHFGIRMNGVDLCPQQLLQAIYATGRGIAAFDLPNSRCSSGPL
jgi:Peptidase family M23/Transglycosylase-like domain